MVSPGVTRGRRSEGGDRQQPARLRRALLPVGPVADAALLLARVLPDRQAALTPPPRWAMLRAPLSYYFLRAGVGESCAVAISGRVRRETVWVPLAKAQSLRAAQGPIQRSLGLASVQGPRRCEVKVMRQRQPTAPCLTRRLI